MDAVKTGIERLGGSVTLASRLGEGTTVRLRLPLTMAVTRVLLLTAGGQRFGVQFVDVIEALSVPAEQVQFVAGGPVLALRQDIVPLVWLGSLLGLPVRHGSEDHNVLIVHTPTGPLGLVVDRFQRDTDVVLKPLDGILGGVPGFCGTALLGDGLVLLVLDVKELNDRAAQIR
jgi:two-component system chemotaxis sensor kinase CheA